MSETREQRRGTLGSSQGHQAHQAHQRQQGQQAGALQTERAALLVAGATRQLAGAS
jgi:hypothetical protein